MNAIQAAKEALGGSSMSITTKKARCVECDWIVPVNEFGTADKHGWIGYGDCPGVGGPTENPNIKVF